MPIQCKLQTLARIAKALNNRRILWAVGGSLMLYLRGIVRDFRDIDLVVALRDAQRAKDCLLALGSLCTPHVDAGFATPCFHEFSIDGVEVDLLADFTVVKEGARHCFPLTEAEITGRAEVDGEEIPLQSLDTWRTCYALMGRADKVRMIDGHTSAQRSST